MSAASRECRHLVGRECKLDVYILYVCVCVYIRKILQLYACAHTTTCWRRDAACPQQYVSIRQHTSAYASAYVSIRQHTRQHTTCGRRDVTKKEKEKSWRATATCIRIRVRMLLYVSAYVSAYYDLRAKGCEKRKRTSLRTAIVCSTFLYRSASTFVPVKQVLLYQ
jgi:hypothetical protein